MSTTYKIVFKGEAVAGHQLFDVKKKFSSIYSISDVETEKYFTGQEVTLKKGMSKEEAQNTVSSFLKRGIQVYLIEEVSSNPYLSQNQHSIENSYSNANGQTSEAYSQDSFNSNYYNTPYEQEGTAFSHDDVVEPATFFSLSINNLRYGRLNYINAIMAWTGIYFVAVMALYILVLSSTDLLSTIQSGELPTSLWGWVVPFLVVILGYVLFVYRATILRLHDLSLSGWWVVALFVFGLVPGIGGLFSIVANILLYALPGTKGPNNFGSPTRQGSIVGLIILCVLLSLCIILIIFSFSIMYSVLSGMKY